MISEGCATSPVVSRGELAKANTVLRRLRPNGALGESNKAVRRRSNPSKTLASRIASDSQRSCGSLST
jgi:hypothetical protein